MTGSTTGPEPFLGVNRSLGGKCWRARNAPARLAETIAQTHALPEVLCRVLAARGVDAGAVESWLNPTLRDLMPPPDRVRDLEKGAARLAAAIRAGSAIGIIGDYDVDGMTSSAILVRFLETCGLTPLVHIPHRVGEGYGPSRQAVSDLKDQGAEVLITLDCGVMAHDPLALAASLGLETIIVDHHQVGEDLPEAHAVINANRADDLSGLGQLCAAGMTFMLVAATSKALREAGWPGGEKPLPDLLGLLDLTALGTVCDVVPLTGLNRAFVVQGLKVMANRGNTGLAALASIAGLKRRPDSHALGFVLGPRLNAAGRIGSALTGLELLTTHDRGRAMTLASELDQLNRQRQAMELRCVEDAIGQAEAALGKSAQLPVLVVSGDGWHPGILGLVAARLKERFSKPAIALGLKPGEDEAPGSGRSVAGIDLGAGVRAAAEAGVVLRGGGHAMAAGLTVETGKIGALRAFLEDYLGGKGDAVEPEQPSLEIDGAMTARAATADFVDLVQRAGPFGSGNPAPVFAFPAHRVVHADGAGADHVRCTLVASDGSRLKAIAFRSLGTPLGETLLSERGRSLHVAGRLAIDDWGGKRQAQLFIDDAALAG